MTHLDVLEMLSDADLLLVTEVECKYKKHKNDQRNRQQVCNNKENKKLHCSIDNCPILKSEELMEQLAGTF